MVFYRNRCDVDTMGSFVVYFDRFYTIGSHCDILGLANGMFCNISTLHLERYEVRSSC